MMQAKRVLYNVLNTDLAQDVLLVASQIGPARVEDGDVLFSIALMHKRPLPGQLYFDQGEPVERKLFCRLRFNTSGILRLQVSNTPRAFIDERPILAWDPQVQHTCLLPQAKKITIRFDETYRGFESSPLKAWIDL